MVDDSELSVGLLDLDIIRFWLNAEKVVVGGIHDHGA